MLVSFDRGPERTGRLFLVAHHLVIDGVSWRILLEDLLAAYTTLAAGQPLVLPPKTTSFRTWATQLEQLPTATPSARSWTYWTSSARYWAGRLPVDEPDGSCRVADNVTVSRSLSADLDGILLHQAPAAAHTRVEELLLTALAQASSPASGGEPAD